MQHSKQLPITAQLHKDTFRKREFDQVELDDIQASTSATATAEQRVEVRAVTLTGSCTPASALAAI